MMIKTLARRALPAPSMSVRDYFLSWVKDIWDLISGRTHDLSPPRHLMFDGPPDLSTYRKNGEEFLKLFRDLTDLRPDAVVLDVGCGIGRKAVPLTRFLGPAGKYEGFDIVRAGIDWCRKHISSRYPRFHFQRIDVCNKHYNPKGRQKASEYRFPFPENTFDFAVATSVFTHMLPEDMANYLSEVSRVLKPDGKCLLTFFLINKASLKSIENRESSLNFAYDSGHFRTTQPDLPETAIGYDEKYLVDLYRKSGLGIIEPIHYGSWHNRSNGLSYQDIIVATKRRAQHP